MKMKMFRSDLLLNLSTNNVHFVISFTKKTKYSYKTLFLGERWISFQTDHNGCSLEMLVKLLPAPVGYILRLGTFLVLFKKSLKWSQPYTDIDDALLIMSVCQVQHKAACLVLSGVHGELTPGQQASSVEVPITTAQHQHQHRSHATTKLVPNYCCWLMLAQFLRRHEDIKLWLDGLWADELTARPGARVMKTTLTWP